MSVNVPAPTPAPTPSPTKLPSSSPSLLPSSSPTIDDAPKVIIDQTTSYMESISCENSFGNLQDYFPISSITFTDPILEDVTIDYDYQIYVSDVQDKDQILSQVEDILFRNIIKASPLSNSEGNPTGSCREMLGDALNINNVRRLNDFTNVLGWNTAPNDMYDVEGTCVSSLPAENGQDVTCVPVKGSITAQIPKQMEGGSVGLDFNVLGQIKSLMEDPNLFLSIEGLNQVQFLGQKSDYDEPRNDPTRPPSSGFFDNPPIILVIRSPTFLNSFNPKPLVVAACEPSLMPEVIVIFCVSKGMPFLLQVIFAFPRLVSAAFPVTLKGLKSTNIKCVSVPPENILNPLFFKVSDKIFALARTDLI